MNAKLWGSLCNGIVWAMTKLMQVSQSPEVYTSQQNLGKHSTSNGANQDVFKREEPYSFVRLE